MEQSLTPQLILAAHLKLTLQGLWELAKAFFE